MQTQQPPSTVQSRRSSWARSVPGIAILLLIVLGAPMHVRADEIPPTVLAVVTHRNLTDLTVVFSEPVSARTAADEWNYSLSDGAVSTEPIFAVLLPNGTNVVLTFPPMISGATYVLSIFGIQDLAVPPNTMTDTNWTFTGYVAPPFPTGAVMWLDADSLQLENGARVGHWPDVSGTGNHALQPDVARQPTLITGATPSGRPVVRFSGASPFQHLTVQGMGPYHPPNTIFLVWKINQNSGADQQPLDGLSDPTRVRVGFQQNPARVFAHSGGTFPNLQKAMTVPFPAYIMMTSVFDTSAGFLRVDGVLESQNATGDIPITGFTIGRRFTESQALFGDIAEVIVFDRRLDEAEIEQVESYLHVKWFAVGGGPVSIISHPVGGTFVEGSMVSLTVAADGGIPMSYQWFRDEAEIPGATNATLLLSPVRLNQGGAYTVRVSNTSGPVMSNPAILTITPDTVKPRLVSGSLGVDPTVLTVSFSEWIDAASVDLDNLQVTSVQGGAGLAILSFQVVNGTNLVLTTSLRTPGSGYRFIASGIRDLAETPNEIEPGSQLVFIPVFAVNEETTWKFFDAGGDPSGDWKAADYDESSWLLGAPVFLAYNAAPPALVDGAPVRTEMNWNSKVIFFRNSFQMPGPVEGASIQLRPLIDDGAIFFLNGVEIFRLGMPAGATGTSTDRASRTAGERGVFEGPFTILPATLAPALREGNNVIAVSVHQVNDTSSDLTFALEMDLTLTSLPLIDRVELSIERSGDNVTISWQGGGLRLQQRGSLTTGDWANVPNGDTSPVTLAIGAGTQFFRLSSE
jgi:hypothetical protein